MCIRDRGKGLALFVDAAHHAHAVQRIGLQRFLAAVQLGRQQGIRLTRLLLECDRQLLLAEGFNRLCRGVGLREMCIRDSAKLEIETFVA